MNKTNTHQELEKYLAQIEFSHQPEAGDYFYTRLKARMEKENNSASWQFPFRPSWIISGLCVLLLINVLLLGNVHTAKKGLPAEKTSLETLGQAYDFTISTPY